MRRKHLAALAAGLSLVGLGPAASMASAATIGQPPSTAFLAIYGSPSVNGKEPVGGGLARNFGFGENMLFEASTVKGVGKNIEINHEEKTSQSEDDYLGGTLQSNRTGVNNPLGVAVQFVDFQDSTFGGVATPHYADTNDRPWIMTICAPGALECRVDPLLTVAAAGVDVKIEDVSLDLGGTVLQGTIWGNWINGKGEKAPPCIKLENRPVKAGADQTLIDTQGGVVGKPITSIAGEFCLISANNDWYKVGAAVKEPAITIENK